jgi:hypothetical protein
VAPPRPTTQATTVGSAAVAAQQQQYVAVAARRDMAMNHVALAATVCYAACLLADTEIGDTEGSTSSLMSIAKDIMYGGNSTHGAHQGDVLWFADSAASIHMVDSTLLPDDCLSDVTPLTGAEVITGGNTILPAIATATYNSMVYLANGDTATFSVANVLLVPGLGGHLFSISRGTQKGVEFALSSELNIMTIGDNTITLVAGRGLYVFSTRLHGAQASPQVLSSQ